RSRLGGRCGGAANRIDRQASPWHNADLWRDTCSKCAQKELQRKKVGSNGPYVQRKCSPCEQDEMHRKAAAGGIGLSVSPAVERGIAVARHGGPADLRACPVVP